MNKTVKRKLSSVIIFLTSFIYFFLAYKGLKQQNINLNNITKVERVILAKGLCFSYNRKHNKAECFYIQLNGEAKKLGVYRSTNNYEDLLDKFNIGDTITAFYRNNNNQKEDLNIDLVQVEKAGQILLDKREYEQKEKSLVYIGLIFGILTVFFSILIFKEVI